MISFGYELVKFIYSGGSFQLSLDEIRWIEDSDTSLERCECTHLNIFHCFMPSCGYCKICPDCQFCKRGREEDHEEK